MNYLRVGEVQPPDAIIGPHNLPPLGRKIGAARDEAVRVGLPCNALGIKVRGALLQEGRVVTRIGHEGAEARGLPLCHGKNSVRGIGWRLGGGKIRRASADAEARSRSIGVNEGHMVSLAEPDIPSHLRRRERREIDADRFATLLRRGSSYGWSGHRRDSGDAVRACRHNRYCADERDAPRQEHQGQIVEHFCLSPDPLIVLGWR